MGAEMLPFLFLKGYGLVSVKIWFRISKVKELKNFHEDMV
jgi:hypothetical protein